MHTALQNAKKETLHQLRAALKKLAKDDDSTQQADRIARDLTLTDIGAIAGIDSYLSDIAGDSGQWFLGQVRVRGRDELFGQVNARAVSYARERAAELVQGIDEATRDDLATLIADGLEENIGMDAIADRISQAYAFSEDRSTLIAKTEIAMANQQGVLEGMRLANKAGVRIKKEWLPDADACDEICQPNGDQGPINLDDTFDSGDDAPPGHPNCRCTMVSEIEENDQQEDEE